MKKFKSISVVAIVLTTSVVGFALDFNSIINENMKAQNELHTQVKESVNNSRLAAQKMKVEDETLVIADTESEVINVKTSKDILTYEKEKKYVKPSSKTNNKRLAQELNSSEY
ncbi:MAG: hypothetical protein ACK41T_08780 [Pseudobdellovibrio sp.]